MKKPKLPLQQNQRGPGNKYLTGVILNADGTGLIPDEQDWICHAANNYEVAMELLGDALGELPPGNLVDEIDDFIMKAPTAAPVREEKP